MFRNQPDITDFVIILLCCLVIAACSIGIQYYNNCGCDPDDESMSKNKKYLIGLLVAAIGILLADIGMMMRGSRPRSNFV